MDLGSPKTADSSDETTRRTFLRTAAATAVGTTAVAGCLGGSDGSAGTPTGGTATGEPDTATATPTAAGSYEVEMAPVGTVTFDAVPETWETYFPGYAEMGIALGQADGLTAIGNSGRFHTSHLEELDGVSVDRSQVTTLIGKSGIDKELYLELDNDVHLTDPQWLTQNDFFGLDRSDVEQIASTVGPFVGNAIFRRTDAWHDYRYYTMYEAFAKVARVFQQQERYRAFRSLHDAVIADVQAKLPPATERPNALLAYAGSTEPEEFSPYRITDKGTNKKHLHDLGVEDALAGSGVQGLSESNRAKIDYETMLEIDPEYILLRGHEDKTASEFESTVLGFMQEHSAASELTAVQNGNVYRGGPIYQGPIFNLFLTERAAGQFYPDTFGGELFDRAKLAGIVTGDATTDGE
jgi:iron complex transport system substrate-binding protein